MSRDAGSTAGAADPDDADLADAATSWRAAYVHVPFCRRRCPYCDFAVVALDETPTSQDPYLAAVVAEIAMEEPWGPLDAVNFGGGTPTQSPVGGLARIVDALADRFGIAAGAEISLEANPEDWDPAVASGLAAAGFTRVSFGAQSFDPAVLAALGRLHTPAESAAAVGAAREAGFESVNIDIIYGTPGESLGSWERTVTATLDLDPDHLSAYALTVEPGTDLSRAVMNGAAAPDPDDQADKWEHLQSAAAAAGLVRYEVSNMARPGHHCRYNLATWSHAEFVGFGMGAHDHRDGARHRNHRRLDRYLESVSAGLRPRLGEERRDGWGREQERVMLGLRRAAGVRPGEVGRALLASPDGERLVSAGVVALQEDRLVVTKPLLTDAVVRAVLSLSQ